MVLMPLYASATGDSGYYVTLSGSVGGSVTPGTVFKFKAVWSSFDTTDGSREFIGDETVTLNTASAQNVKFPLKNEYVENGGYVYEFSMVSCSDSKAGVDTKIVSIYLKKDVDSGELIASLVDSSVEGESDIEFPHNIDFDCKTGVPVTVEFLKDSLTKVYDGTDAYTLLPGDYRIAGIADGDDVKLNVKSAKFNSADVKTANKVTFSGLSLAGPDAGKYIFKTAELSHIANITARPITVTADSFVITKGEQVPELTYSLSEPLIVGNEFVGSLTRQQGDAVGEYSINRGTLMLNDNYEVTFNEGKLTISNFGKSTLVDSATSVSVSGFFAESSKLNVSDLSVADNVYKVLAANSTWGKIIKGYNITLSGEHDGSLDILIPLGSEYEGKSITVYQSLTSGGIASYKADVLNGTISIVADEGTAFLLVTVKDTVKPKTSVGKVILTAVIVILAVVFGLALLATLFFFGMIFFNKTDELKRMIKAIKKSFKKKPKR